MPFDDEPAYSPVRLGDLWKFARFVHGLEDRPTVKEAAESLERNRAAFSRWLHTLLEKFTPEVRARLVVKTKNGFETTDEGRAFLEYAEKVLALSNDAERTLRGVKIVRVAATDMGQSILLPRVLSRGNHEVDIRIAHGSYREIAVSVATGMADFGLLQTSHIGNPGGYVLEPLASTDPALLYCRRKFRKEPSLKQLAGHPFLFMHSDIDRENEDELKRLRAGRLGIGNGRMIGLPSVSTVIAWVRSGLGIGFGTRNYLEEDDSDIGLIDIRGYYPQLVVRPYLVLPEGGFDALSEHSRKLALDIRRVLGPAEERPPTTNR